MRHLFIINPISYKVRKNADTLTANINRFFREHTELDYDIHHSRWDRDALGYVRRYMRDAGDEIVRVHSLGGTGTLFEITNAVVNVPNAQVAIYPMGRTNTFLHYFGKDKEPLFASLEHQVFSGTVGVDVIRCGHNYSISNALVGFEALVDREGDRLIERTRMNNDFCYLCAISVNIFRRHISQEYKITLDGVNMDGEYMSILIANQPWYGLNMCPGIDARPNSGLLDIYIMRDSNNRYQRIKKAPAYVKGNYQKYPEALQHYTGRKIKISSDKMMCLSVDGETFYGNKSEYEIMPGAINFVCPSGIDF